MLFRSLQKATDILVFSSRNVTRIWPSREGRREKRPLEMFYQKPNEKGYKNLKNVLELILFPSLMLFFSNGEGQ